MTRYAMIPYEIPNLPRWPLGSKPLLCRLGMHFWDVVPFIAYPMGQDIQPAIHNGEQCTKCGRLHPDDVNHAYAMMALARHAGQDTVVHPGLLPPA